MKKIIIIDGGPRHNMNTAEMLKSFENGAMETAGEKIEVKSFRLYDLSYRGCLSCLGCKLKNKSSRVCVVKDGLHEILAEIASADGLVLGSPVYMGEVTGQMRCFLERLVFPWLSYNDFTVVAPRKIPVVCIYTMNATEDMLPLLLPHLEFTESMIANGLMKPERIIAFNTVMVKDASRYDMAALGGMGKEKHRELHWKNELKQAHDAGCRMAEAILTK